MEKPIHELMRNATGATPRRGFFRRIAGAMALGLVLRHDAFPLALGDEMWRKYKMGEAFKINDPETKAPALKNPFLHPKAGVLPADGMAIDRLLASGTVFGACHVALLFQSRMLAGNPG
jgi:hypothetical protein